MGLAREVGNTIYVVEVVVEMLFMLLSLGGFSNGQSLMNKGQRTDGQASRMSP